MGRAEVIIAQLRDAITSGALVPGQKLNLDDLAREFGVSRMPVRDALKALEGEGLVRIYPYRGMEVSRLTAGELEELFALREVLEAKAVERGVPRLTAADLDQMRELLREMDELETLEAGWFAANAAFHGIINRASGWPRLLEMLSVLRTNAERYVRDYVRDEGRAKSQAQHWELYRACEARDVVAARQVIRKHLRDTAAALLKAMPTDPETDSTAPDKIGVQDLSAQRTEP